MKRISIFLFIALFLSIHSHAQIVYSIGFPRWLRNDSYRTDQTSGIVFLREQNNKCEYLLVDDIGQMHRLFIDHDTVFQFRPIIFTDSVKNYLENFPKKDFEEVTYDKFTGKVYMSIEGNYPAVNETAGIYEVQFGSNDIFNDTVTRLIKLDIKPAEQFYQFVENNIGYEGLAVDSNYLYLGLEGFQSGSTFADSTFIYIVRKSDLNIIARLSTKAEDIHTICGLYCYAPGRLLCIDRNERVLHAFDIDPGSGLFNHSRIALPAQIPGYPDLPYTASLESVTMDPHGNIFLVDDPWKSRFIPEKQVFDKLDQCTRKNFSDIIPVIYKLHKTIFLKEK